MKRAIFLVPVMGVLAACQPPVPDSGAGFNTPDYQAQRTAALEGETVNGDPLVPPSAVSTEPLPLGSAQTTAEGTRLVPAPTAVEAGTDATGAPLYVPQQGDTSQDIANETAAALAASNANSGVAPLQASPTNPAPPVLNSAGLSEEQDFGAVSSTRSIEGDAQRLEQARANYEVVQPTAVPQRSGEAQPNIVQYALTTNHPKGTQVYSRAGFNLEAKAQRACAGYPSADQAQIAFLEGGGPQRDRKGLDPDGDGYACGWDPSTFRRAVGN
ncbi:hypothetical protein ACFORG_16910 [Lutimaribacter marinistellae]|uniref:Excalibur calcium-binding domain-containing protein n=1 Tax=Lutimaribacter marinistellae TaxID=1820329 RepID=A0ABV7TKZ7_9RHOB